MICARSTKKAGSSGVLAFGVLCSGLFATYCTVAIRHNAATKLAENLRAGRSSTGPKHASTTHTVRKVEQAIMAALKICTLIFLLTRNEEHTAAAVATRIPDSPPQDSMVRNTKESLTVISPLMLGICTTSRAPRTTIRRNRIRKRMSSCGVSRLRMLSTITPHPRATTKAIKGLTKRCLSTRFSHSTGLSDTALILCGVRKCHRNASEESQFSASLEF